MRGRAQTRGLPLAADRCECLFQQPASIRSGCVQQDDNCLVCNRGASYPAKATGSCSAAAEGVVVLVVLQLLSECPMFACLTTYTEIFFVMS